MSVRRLAEDTLQPESFAFTKENAAWAEATIRKYPEGRQQSAVIPLLMRAQDQDGWVTKAAIEHVADMLHMPLIRVLEVATFYTQFQLKPVGTRAHIQVCGTTPCMLRGAEDLKAVCRKKIHAEPFHRNADGTLSWEEVECLGACVNAPMVMIFEDTYEDLTPERLEEIIDLFEAGRGGEVKAGPAERSASVGADRRPDHTHRRLRRHCRASARRTRAAAPRTSDSDAGRGCGAGGLDAAVQGRASGHRRSPRPIRRSRRPARPATAMPPQGGEDEESDRLTGEAHRPGAGQTGGTRARADRRGRARRDRGGRRHPPTRPRRPMPRPKARSGEGSRGRGGRGARRLAPGRPAPRRSGGGRTPICRCRPERRDAGRGAAGRDVRHPARPRAMATTSPARRRRQRPRRQAGEKPADLLSEPQGEQDDLKKIKGDRPGHRDQAERPRRLPFLADRQMARGRADLGRQLPQLPRPCGPRRTGSSRPRPSRPRRPPAAANSDADEETTRCFTTRTASSPTSTVCGTRA